MAEEEDSEFISKKLQEIKDTSIHNPYYDFTRWLQIENLWEAVNKKE